jgi:hypothetical protein
VDVGREYLYPFAPGFVEEGSGAVEAHRLGVEEGAEELGRVVTLHVGAGVGERGEGGGVGGRKAISGEALHPGEDLVGDSPRDPACDGAADELLF